MKGLVAHKNEFRDRLADSLPDLDVHVGGAISIDVTLKGVDKAFGMAKLLDMLSIDKSEVLYFGDMLQEGDNDYPIKTLGVDTIEVGSWQDTALILNQAMASDFS